MRLRSTDRAGHMAVGGMLGAHRVDGAVRMEFDPFAIDPSSLPELVRIARAMQGRQGMG